MNEETTHGETNLHETIVAMQGGLNFIDKGKGITQLDHWITTLQSQERPELKSIADDLAVLKETLNEEVVSRQTISEKLISVGQKTAEVASAAGGQTRLQLAALGNILTKAGNSIR
ncbi:MAG: hypothetical protein WBA12_09520 [Catalinimonas sp.]